MYTDKAKVDPSSVDKVKKTVTRRSAPISRGARPSSAVYTRPVKQVSVPPNNNTPAANKPRPVSAVPNQYKNTTNHQVKPAAVRLPQSKTESKVVKTPVTNTVNTPTNVTTSTTPNAAPAKPTTVLPSNK